MTLPRYVPSQAALGYVAEPLAEFFVRDVSAQHFDLREQVMAKVPFHGRPPERELFENKGLHGRTRVRRHGYS
jgi:hypothetical protein